VGLGPGPKPPHPTPAAASDSDRDPAPEIPLASASNDDAVVRIVADGFACTGTLITEELVLTAHHCVALRNEYGEPLHEDVAPQTIRIELGGDHLPWGELTVRAIVAPPCGHRAGHGDVAVLVLERPLVGAPTLDPRIESPPKDGETVTPVGFGRCSASPDGIRRRTRDGGNVDMLAAGRFRLNASICPGDSGGPGLSDRGEVVGVISASVMDRDEQTRGRTEFTRLDAFQSVFATAQLVADGASILELPPVDGCSETPDAKRIR
jgi:hypothetical protein